MDMLTNTVPQFKVYITLTCIVIANIFYMLLYIFTKKYNIGKCFLHPHNT